MTYEEWCEKNILPIVTQYNDGAITISELANAVANRVLHRPEDLVEE